MKKNYQAEMEKIISGLQNKGHMPRLLLHACCAPCSSYVLEYLTEYFDITLFFYNPNITSPDEYEHRISELRRLAGELPHKNNIEVIDAGYSPKPFLKMAKGLETIPEGGIRCFGCYRLRLEATAEFMAAHRDEYDYFCTTLTVSPHKNSDKLNEIGLELEKSYGVPYLPSDFKKKNGYKRSVELSGIYRLYRQSFCGCEYSRAAGCVSGK